MDINRPSVVGKFLNVGGKHFFLKGVAYGTFAPDPTGQQFPARTQVAADFAQMRALHINTVRTYTPPPVWLLDEAERYGLRVMVGIAWPQHVAFLDDRRLRREIRRTIREHVRRLMPHPAALIATVGNEIPPGLVRWHGAARIEAFLNALYDDAKDAVPDAIVSYINFPPTEYLDTSRFDVCSMNVYLHREADLRAYVTRLQHIAGQRPLLLTELGADSIREGEEGQAALTAMQLRTAFSCGAAGAVAFTWTDDWWRGGQHVTDWAFGLVDVERRPKLVADAVARVYASAPFPPAQRNRWPKVSVAVCAYNAASTLEDCLTALRRLNYPDYEVIVVDDGSRDGTAEIARRHPVTLLSVANGGLSAARNLAAQHATGDIVAYTDADARVDPEWLTFLVQPFVESNAAISGGPNIVPADDPWLAQCVARSPGGPTHVLLDDTTAEHVPGVNMAFRRQALLDLGGFNPLYHAAGDDVDVCWRFQARGYRLGFAPAALVWHHHRASVRAYWRQQTGYGEAETCLMRHHPEKFLDGQARWVGRIYSPLSILRAMSKVRVNAGVWGTSPFPSVYTRHWPRLAFWPHLIPWQLTCLLLMLGGLASWSTGAPVSARVMVALGVAGLLITLGRCGWHAWRSDLRNVPAVGHAPPWASRLVYRLTIAWLHFLQPLAREWGRTRGRLWPRDLSSAGVPPTDAATRERAFAPALAIRLLVTPRVTRQYWSEQWLDRVAWLTTFTSALRRSGVGRSVNVDDGWQQQRDLAVLVGHWAALNLRCVVEEHERGRCLLRTAAELRLTPLGGAMTTLLISLLVTAGFGGSLVFAATVFVTGAVSARRFVQLSSVAGSVQRQLSRAADDFALLPLDGTGRAVVASDAERAERASPGTPYSADVGA